MRRIALLLSIMMVCITSLVTSAVAFGDDDDDRNPGDCQYEHSWSCDDDD